MTTATPFPSSTCPPWCDYAGGPDHDHDLDDGSGGKLHRGPIFGDCLRAAGIEVGDGSPMRVVVVTTRQDWDELAPAELRHLARDAEQAARWLEAHSGCPAWCEDSHDNFALDGGIPLHRSSWVSPEGCPGILLGLSRDDADGRTLLNIHSEPGMDPHVELTEGGAQVKRLLDAILELEGLYDATLHVDEADE